MDTPLYNASEYQGDPHPVLDEDIQRMFEGRVRVVLKSDDDATRGGRGGRDGGRDVIDGGVEGAGGGRKCHDSGCYLSEEAGGTREGNRGGGRGYSSCDGDVKVVAEQGAEDADEGVSGRGIGGSGDLEAVQSGSQFDVELLEVVDPGESWPEEYGMTSYLKRIHLFTKK